MFFTGGSYLSNYVATQGPGDRNFYYMTSYNQTEVKVVSDCYYYSKGV